MEAKYSAEEIVEKLKALAQNPSQGIKELSSDDLSQVSGGLDVTLEGDKMNIALNDEEYSKIQEALSSSFVKQIVSGIFSSTGLEGVEITQNVTLPKEKGEQLLPMLQMFLG